MLYELIVLASAATPAAPTIGGTLPTGKDLAEQCADCHGVAEGEMYDVTVQQVKDIVNGKTPHKSKIKLSDQQIADLVAYFKTIK